MGGILLLAGGVGVLCAAGTGISATLKWFHSWEPDFSGKEKKGKRGGANHDKVEAISKKFNAKSDIY